MDFPIAFSHRRVLILAPHPDDESLATGGLIQRALAEGAEVRVVFITDGDNNPWPQRYLERRWRITPADRQRWGARRRQEALSALRLLGVSPEQVHFLGLPDQGTTASLLRTQPPLVRILADVLSAWPADLLIAPSPHDTHPDHNALAVLVDLALANLPVQPPPQLIHYLVHTRRQLPAPAWTIRLSPAERALKEQAILEHGSQMVLSRKRFVAYARDAEQFYPPEAKDQSHPIQHACLEDGALCVRLRPATVSPFHGDLLVTLESPLHGSLRWRLRLDRHPGTVRVLDEITRRPLRQATIRSVHQTLEVRLPISSALPIQHLAVKFDRRIAFYDEAGWRRIELPVPAKPVPIGPLVMDRPYGLGSVHELSSSVVREIGFRKTPVIQLEGDSPSAR